MLLKFFLTPSPGKETTLVVSWLGIDNIRTLEFCFFEIHRWFG